MDSSSIIEKTVAFALEKKKTGNCCSVSVAAALQKTFGNVISEELLNSMVIGLGGGMGFSQEGSCGCISGGTVAMGLYFQEDTKAMRSIAKEFTKDFQQHMGSIVCKHIVTETGEKRCLECVATATKKAAELMIKAGKLPSTEN